MKAKVCIGKLLLIAIALCLHFSGMSQGFNYQAVIRDANGAAITNRNIKIRITLQNTQGTQFFSENKALTTSAQGVINHVVGSGTITLGALTNVPWNSGDIKIKVDIDPTGGTNYTLVGNPTLIQPVPFALYAATGTQGPAGQDGLSIDWLGNFFNAPNTPSKNQAYYNLNDKIAYIYNGAGWDILAKDGTNGTDGTNGIDGVSISWLGDFDNPPAGSKNKAYYNNTEKKSYIHDGTGWVIMTVDGKDGKDGTNGTNGTNGLSIHWLGNLNSQPSGTLNDAYYNINDKKSYIFNGLSWDQLTQDGTDGVDGTSIHWLGDLGAHPAAVLNNAYYNTADKKSYIYDGSNWVTLAKDGAKGDPGPGLINKGTWVANTPYISGNYVFHRSTASSSVNSMYICQLDVTSATEPYLDGTHWVELQSIKGDKGDTGTPGTNGISIQWLGIASSNPANPLVNQAFYHTGQKKSLIYNGSVWQTMAIDGSNGINGISINWQGPLGAYPGSPSLNTAFYHTGEKKSYIWNGAGWSILAVDGTNGTNGTNGSNGTNGISIQWLGNLATAPQTPSLNQAYYHIGDKKSYIYNGSGWSTLAQDGMPISGTSGQTLYYNGAWTPTSTITNDGTNVGVGIAPTAKLDVNGGIRLRSALYDNTSTSLNSGTTDQILTSTGTGILWKSPSGIGGVATGTGAAGQLALWSGSNSLNGVTNLSWGTSLQVASNTTAGPDDPIFEVKNKDGKVVFGVYQGGVRVYVEDSPTVKGARGGFAVGGLSQTKGVSNEYLKITPDSARIYIDNTGTKGARGGFAVGGLSQTKGTEEYLRITPDSARIYIDDNPIVKGARGGFAVGGLSQTKALPQEYLRITPDSARVYVKNSPTKGARGGFAVGGLSQTKTTPSNFMALTPDNYFIGHNAGSSNDLGLYNSFFGYNAGLKNKNGNQNIFIGYQTGYENLFGSWNTFLGFEAGLSNTGSDNTFIGYKAGRAHQTKGGNVYIGSKAGELALDGEQNVLIGESSGTNITAASKNVFVGYQTGNTNTTGSSNVFVGNVSGWKNSTGMSNAFIGDSAGYNNTNSFNVFIGKASGKSNQGQFNAFMGNQAGFKNTTGENNVYIGNQTGKNSTTGSYNTFLGYQSGFSSNSSYNTFLGYQTGYLTTANYNSFVGYQSGNKNTTGASNVLIGFMAGYWNQSGSNNVLIGNVAGYGKSGSSITSNVFLGDSAGYENTNNYNVFLGKGSGKANTGNYNAFMGHQAGLKNSSGSNNVFIGNQTGYKNTTGSYNTYLGYQSGYSSNASYNTLLGYQAGYSTTANYNSFVGYQAGKANTIGKNNAYMGYNAGVSSISGSYNTFMGNEAGKSNTVGDFNVFIGHQSGYTDTASYNTFIGYKTGYNNFSGRYNVFLGYESGWYSGSGTTSDPSYNTFIGYQTGKYNQTGQYNTYIGYQAGSALATNIGTGNNNVAIGYNAGMKLTSSTNNVFIGTEAGASTTSFKPPATEGANTFIGYQAGKENTTSYHCVAIGYMAGRTLSTNERNTLVGSLSGELLNIGTGNAFFGAYTGREASSGNRNTFIGYDAGYHCRTGSQNTYLGYTAGRGWGVTNKGDSCVFLGAEAGVDEAGSNKLYIDNMRRGNPLIWGDFKLGYATIHGKFGVNTKAPGYSVEAWGTNASLIAHYSGQARGGVAALTGGRVSMLTTYSGDKLVFGYSSDVDQADFSTYFVERMRIDNASGYVGIGITAPTHILHINGQGRSTSASWATTSDIRLKDVKGNFNYGLKEILKLEAVRFNYKKDNPLKLPSDIEHVGIIAQELKEVIPEAVTMNSDGYYTVSTDPIFWSMLNAIKEQQKTIDEQQKKIDKLEQKNAEIDALKSELEAIKAMLKK